MKKADAAIVLFYTKDRKIMLQDRKSISKFGEEWSFFGGKVEKGETPKEGAVREIDEELEYHLTDFKQLSTIKKIVQYNHEMYETTYHIFIKEIEENPKLFNVKEGDGLGFFTIDEAFELKLGPYLEKSVLNLFRNFISGESVLDL